MYARLDWATLQPGLTLFALCLLPLLLPDAGTFWLEYQYSALVSGELWRLWSGHLVHYSPIHAGLDGGACLVLATSLQQAGHGQGVLLRLTLIAPLLSLVILLAVPEMQIYRGASGLVLALMAALWLSLWRTQSGWRPALLLLAGALLIKICADALQPGQTVSSLPAGVESAWQVHLAGLILGFIFWWRSKPAAAKPAHISAL